jgi:hypothetical protein
VIPGSVLSPFSTTTPSNQVPTATITSPVIGANFIAPASLTINVTASDADGTISKVEFFNGNIKLGEDLSAPYNFTWNNVGAGTYQLTAKATDNLGAIATSAALSVTVNSLTSTCGASGSILKEYWANIPGVSVSNIPLNTNPSSTSQLSSFEAPANTADNYGQRIRGYLCPPLSGQYWFAIASDDNSELWLSTDENPANKVKIASVTGWTNPREWKKYTSQLSQSIQLQAGKMIWSGKSGHKSCLT